MRETNYTPSEWLETQDKVKEHKKGQELANFYRLFLDKFQREVWNLLQSYRRDGMLKLDITNLTISEIIQDPTNEIKSCIDKATEEASEITGFTKSLKIDSDALVNMSPSQFKQHIDELKSSLFKDKYELSETNEI